MSTMRIWMVAYNHSVYKGCFKVFDVSLNRVSTILSDTDSAIYGLHSHIGPKWMYKSALLRKKQMTRLLPHPENERQRSINDVWHRVMKHPVRCADTVSHNRTIGRLPEQKFFQKHRYYDLKMSVNGASTTFSRVSWRILGLLSEISR